MDILLLLRHADSAEAVSAALSYELGSCWHSSRSDACPTPFPSGNRRRRRKLGGCVQALRVGSPASSTWPDSQQTESLVAGLVPSSILDGIGGNSREVMACGDSKTAKSTRAVRLRRGVILDPPSFVAWKISGSLKLGRPRATDSISGGGGGRQSGDAMDN